MMSDMFLYLVLGALAGILASALVMWGVKHILDIRKEKAEEKEAADRSEGLVNWFLKLLKKVPNYPDLRKVAKYLYIERMISLVGRLVLKEVCGLTVIANPEDLKVFSDTDVLLSVFKAILKNGLHDGNIVLRRVGDTKDLLNQQSGETEEAPNVTIIEDVCVSGYAVEARITFGVEKKTDKLYYFTLIEWRERKNPLIG